MYDTEDDNSIVTSVSWMKNKSILAIGTSENKVELWDAEKFQKVGEVDG